MKKYFDKDGEELTQQEYLYGKDVEVEPIPQEAINKRVEVLKKHLSELLDHSYHTRDTKRVSSVLNAIKYWEHINDVETI